MMSGRRTQVREHLAALTRGGSREHPIVVDSASVIEVRVAALACPQCAGDYRIREHVSIAAGVRRVDVRCVNCGTERALWFRIGTREPN